MKQNWFRSCHEWLDIPVRRGLFGTVKISLPVPCALGNFPPLTLLISMISGTPLHEGSTRDRTNLCSSSPMHAASSPRASTDSSQNVMDSTMFNGKIHYKWWFSIAMLNYQRVSSFRPLCRTVHFFTRNSRIAPEWDMARWKQSSENTPRGADCQTICELLR